MKKLLVIVLALSLTLGCFTGCGSETVETNAPTDAVETKGGDTEETTSSASEEVDSNFNETGYPIVDEKVTLELYAVTSIADPNAAEYYQRLEELTNVHIEWITVPEDSAQERINLMFTGTDLPDAISKASKGISNIQGYASEGLIMPLNDLIDKYMPNFKERGADIMSSITYPDGNIYCFPYVTDYFWMSSNQAVYINQQWLDNLGLEMPTTTEEFENVLRAFKEQDANGNGDPNDEIPYSAQKGTWQHLFNMISGAFGYPLGDYQVHDGVVIDPRTDEGLKDAIKYLRGLYVDGLIDQEIFTQSKDAQIAKTKLETPIVGVTAIWRAGTSFLETTEGQYTYLAPLTGPDGESAILGASAPKKIGDMVVVTADCEYPEVLARWIDTLYSEEWSVQMSKGALGVTCEQLENGLYKVWDNAEGHNMTFGEYLTQIHYQQMPYIVSDDLFYSDGTDANDKGRQDDFFEATGKVIPAYPKLLMTAEEEEEFNLLMTDVDKYAEETICRWISGQGDVDAEWDAYIAQMKVLGHDRMIEIKQQVYDRNYK